MSTAALCSLLAGAHTAAFVSCFQYRQDGSHLLKTRRCLSPRVYLLTHTVNGWQAFWKSYILNVMRQNADAIGWHWRLQIGKEISWLSETVDPLPWHRTVGSLLTLLSFYIWICHLTLCLYDVFTTYAIHLILYCIQQLSPLDHGQVSLPACLYNHGTARTIR